VVYSSKADLPLLLQVCREDEPPEAKYLYSELSQAGVLRSIDIDNPVWNVSLDIVIKHRSLIFWSASERFYLEPDARELGVVEAVPCLPIVTRPPILMEFALHNRLGIFLFY
jgi:hypothetical protein